MGIASGKNLLSKDKMVTAGIYNPPEDCNISQTRTDNMYMLFQLVLHSSFLYFLGDSRWRFRTINLRGL